MLAALGVCTLAGQEAKNKADDEFFTKQVKPIFEAHCFQCHSHAMKKAKGNLVVDARASILKGGNSGPAIVPGHPEKSLLIKAISYIDDEELRMPPKGKLPEPAIAVLREWVRRGAPGPGEEEQTLRRPGTITDEDRAWWAFQPVRRPALPDLSEPPLAKGGIEGGWSNNPIDRFIKVMLDNEILQPAPVSGPRELIRRVYFDLIGLPPTPAEVDEFVAACKPTESLPRAYEKLVDRLLASPRYGERMGRVWLDLV